MQNLTFTKRTLLFIVMVGTLLGAGIAGAFTFNGSPVAAQTDTTSAEVTDADTAEVDEANETDDDAQEPALNGSIAVDEAQFEGMSEADEAAALEGLATLTADDAKAIAESETGATATEVELDDENGSLVYSVTLDDGQEVLVDAGNGSVLLTEAADSEADDEDEADEVAPADLAISIEEAQAIVEAANPDATVLEMEYEEEGGVQMYEAELDNGSEVMIDANTGEILASASDNG